MIQVQSQACNGMSQYDQCSKNPACACFHLSGIPSNGICIDRYAAACSDLMPCNNSTQHCNQSGHRCVLHPECRDVPVCFPIPNYNKQFCTLLPSK